MERKEEKTKKKMRKWRRGKCEMEEYLKERKEYKIWCREKKKEYERQEEEKIRKIKTEQEAWKYINRFRKRRKGVSEEISEERWKRYFMETLEGEEQTALEEGEEEREMEEKREEESEITKEELIKQLKRMKIGVEIHDIGEAE